MSFNPNAGTIAGAADAALSNPADNQVLSYDSGSAKWANATPEISAINGLQTLLDTKVESVTAGENVSVDDTDPRNLVINAVSDFLSKNNIVEITDSVEDFFARVEINDDGSPTATWSDRLAFYFDGTRTGYFNEYGELRARPAKTATVGFRAMAHPSASDTQQYFQVTPTGTEDPSFGISKTRITTNNIIREDIYSSNPGTNYLNRTVTNYPMTTSNPDVDQVVVNGVKTAWHNEWGALRGTAPYDSGYGDALVRAIRTDSDVINGDQAVEIVDRRTGASNNVMWGRKWTDGSLVRNGNTMADMFVIENGETPPSNLPAGTVIIELEA